MKPHSSHWGAFFAQETEGGITLRPHPDDPDPSPILANLPDAVRHSTRIQKPAIRRGWLSDGPGPSTGRGSDLFVSVDWDGALDLVSRELRRVYSSAGPSAVFGGSYGWSSAGRFHHAQSQLHRFLNGLGGYLCSVNTYSAGAAMVILPHVLASRDEVSDGIKWPDIVKNTDLILAFGGMPSKNTAIGPGGIGQHLVKDYIRAAKSRGCRFVNVSPLRGDSPDAADAEWVPIRPGTDVAMMLGIAYTLLSEGNVDREFLARCTVGFPTFERYVLGDTDGLPKTAAWAARITGISSELIALLARQASRHRTLITVSNSLQRAEHGEQPVWMGITLAAMLGQLGLDGAGFTYGLGGFGSVGNARSSVTIPSLPQGQNSVSEFIPVARIADMLLRPGETYEFNGMSLTYPKALLVYWAGGNPFHHHQDLNRLRKAFSRPQTVIVHENFWTPMARHADLVFPATVTLERDDIGIGANDALLIAMHRVLAPFGGARNDHQIFADLARSLGTADWFTAGRTEPQWIEYMYESVREQLVEQGISAPQFEQFWELGELRLPSSADHRSSYGPFRDDPVSHPLNTPSGRIEIFSETVSAFGYDDCPGHPVWLEPAEGWGSPRAAEYPLQLVANQPASRLHGQLDMGATSKQSKIQDREPFRISSADALRYGVTTGDVVRVFNDRGACLASVVVTDDIRLGVVQLATGAWYDPLDSSQEFSLCVHGNPNVLTKDSGTSRLAQGCIGQLCLVQIEKFTGTLPPVRAHMPPRIADGRLGVSHDPPSE